MKSLRHTAYLLGFSPARGRLDCFPYQCLCWNPAAWQGARAAAAAEAGGGGVLPALPGGSPPAQPAAPGPLGPAVSVTRSDVPATRPLVLHGISRVSVCTSPLPPAHLQATATTPGFYNAELLFLRVTAIHLEGIITSKIGSVH